MRRLGALKLGALEVVVCTASVEEVPSLAGEWGHYDPETKTIYLPVSMQPDRFEVILLHEILHACLDVTQMGVKIAAAAKKKHAEHLEEDIVSALSNTLAQALQGAKKLKRPKVRP